MGGLAGGLLLAVAGLRFMGSMLVGVEPGDPFIYGTALVVMTVTAVLASYLPARRAIRLDPVETLRVE